VTRNVTDPFRDEVVGGKGSVYYRAHSYHTKVPPEGIVRMVEHYTDPGDTVLDPFCGSGMTGVACLLSGRMGLLSDLSPAAVHIAAGMVTRPDPVALADATDALLASTETLETELYGTTCGRCAGPARVEYTVWSDTLTCPACASTVLFWDAARRADGTLDKTLRCPACRHTFRKADSRVGAAAPVLVSVACLACRTREQRLLTAPELAVSTHDHRADTTDWYPTAPFEPWREMWRGQHRNLGIATAADFFTGRNLRALAAAWAAANESVEPTASRFAVTAIVNRASRRYQWNPKRPTNVLSGTMYLASMTYEFNVFSLLRRKVTAVRRLAAALSTTSGSCIVTRSSATDLGRIPDGAVDYVFTDPPFGANIYYSDASFLWEAWLDDFTPTADEAVVSTSLAADHGGKTLQDYEKLMAGSFSEIARVLRPGAWASVMFHNSDDAVWSSLERALESADLRLESAIAFDKSQPSFKGVKQITANEKVSSFDLVLHLRTAGVSRTGGRAVAPADDAGLLTALDSHIRTAPPARRTTPYLHSLVMRHLLEHGQPLAGHSYRHVENLLAAHYVVDAHGSWHPPTNPTPSTKDPQ
jgi:DNA modification methylase